MKCGRHPKFSLQFVFIDYFPTYFYILFEKYRDDRQKERVSVFLSVPIC